jgi:hypothetical protein
VGHQPQVELSPSQKALFQAFQANLVSLLSHELRTPIMAIQNALCLLETKNQSEALTTAQEQLQKLDAVVSTLLDLAAWEAGSLQVHLSQGPLWPVLEASGLTRWLNPGVTGHPESFSGLVSLDFSKLSRALSRLREFAENASYDLSSRPPQLQMASTGFCLLLFSHVDRLPDWEWEELWHEIQVAREAGTHLPLKVFAGMLQDEGRFLARRREGLGAELHLLAEILRQHQAQFQASYGPVPRELIPGGPQGVPEASRLLRFEVSFPEAGSGR